MVTTILTPPHPDKTDIAYHGRRILLGTLFLDIDTCRAPSATGCPGGLWLWPVMALKRPGIAGIMYSIVPGDEPIRRRHGFRLVQSIVSSGFCSILWPPGFCVDERSETAERSRDPPLHRLAGDTIIQFPFRPSLRGITGHA